FVACVANLYAGGCRRLIVDLQATTRVELSGLFALHSVTRLFNGEAMPNSESGWGALHESVGLVSTTPSEEVKLLAPPPAVARAIEQSSLCQPLKVYPDLASASASYR